MEQNVYKVMIVDDEALARELLKEYVALIPGAVVAGSCASAEEATALLAHEPVDIILSDIQMPDLSGIDFIRTLRARPAVIFTTAYSEYAVEGFNLSVTDFLLKPIAFPRFEQAMKKAMAYTDLMRHGTLPPDSAGPETPAAGAGQVITIKADRKLHRLNCNDILFIEGQHEYVTFHTVQRRITALYALKTLEDMLPRQDFVRVHKSYIVSVRHIDAVSSGSLQIQGTEIPIGKNYRQALMDLLDA